MKTAATLSLLLLLSTAVAFADDEKPSLSLSFDSEDARVLVGPRHVARDARIAIETRNGSAVLLLEKDAVAIQLSDSALAKLAPKPDPGLLEELASTVVTAVVRKAVSYPIANIRSVVFVDNTLILTNDEGKPVFSDLKVNGAFVTRDLNPADVVRFINTFQEIKAGR